MSEASLGNIEVFAGYVQVTKEALGIFVGDFEYFAPELGPVRPPIYTATCDTCASYDDIGDDYVELVETSPGSGIFKFKKPYPHADWCPYAEVKK